jgi:hypothetical protein
MSISFRSRNINVEEEIAKLTAELEYTKVLEISSK